MPPYTKQTWTNDPATTTPINAERLGHIEDGIEASVQSYSVNVPAGAGPTTINHALDRSDVAVSVRRVSTGAVVGVGVTVVDDDNVSLDFGTYVPVADEFRVTVVA